jgi:hypothetical protein
MITFLSYFIVPTAIFLVLVKLNNKRRWIVSSNGICGHYNYFTKNGREVDKIIFWFITTLYFVFWPIFIPVMCTILGIFYAVRWLTNGEGVIPTDNNHR